MPEHHLTAAEARLLVTSRLDTSERTRILGHLFSGCVHCQALVAEAFQHGSTTLGSPHTERSHGARALPIEKSWERAIAGVRDHADSMEHERDSASLRVAELSAIPKERWPRLVRNEPRFQSWALVEHLLKMSWESRYESLAAMRDLAEAAVLVVAGIPELKYGRAAIHDLRGRARTYLANACSANKQLDKARLHFELAANELTKGTGDRLERALLLIFEATFLQRQNRLEPARRNCDRAIRLAEMLEQPTLLGRALTKKAEVLFELGCFEDASRFFRRSVNLLNSQPDRRLLLSCKHNLALCYYFDGHLEVCLTHLEETRPLYVELGDRLNLLRLLHFEAEIATTLEDFQTAERYFAEAQNGFLESSVDWEAAEVSLKLAQVYLRQGKLTACRELAEQLLPIFESRQLHTEAIAAMMLVREAMLAETVTLHMVQETIDFLQRVRTAA